MKKFVLLLSFLLLTITSCLFESKTNTGTTTNTTTTLSIPTGLTASQGTSSTQINLSWNAVGGASYYNVYRATSSSGSYSYIGYTTAPTTTAYDNSITVGTRYFYRVTAEDADGNETDGSNVAEGWAATTTLPAPTGLTASQGTSSTQINLSWTAVTGAAYYNVYRSTTENGSYVGIGSVTAPTVATYNSTDSPTAYTITVGTHYFYKVTALNSSYNESDKSTAAEGWAGTTTPAWVNASYDIFTNKIVLECKYVSDAASYNVYRSTSSTGSYTKIGSSSSYYYDNTTSDASYSATKGTTYYYKMTAVNSSGIESSQSPVSNAGRVSSSTTPGTITINNNSSSGYAIWFVYIAPSSSTTWGPEMLGVNTLSQGGVRSWTTVAPNTYDILAYASDMTHCASYSNKALSAGGSISETITSTTWTACPSSKSIGKSMEQSSDFEYTTDEIYNFESCSNLRVPRE